MREELKEKLLKEFPFLFESPYFRGINIGSGWFPLVYSLCKDLTKFLKIEPMSSIKILIVKEEYGGLRVYASVYPKYLVGEVFMRIHETELKSRGICEVCGGKGSLCTNSYSLKTLCSKCANKLGFLPVGL